MMFAIRVDDRQLKRLQRQLQDMPKAAGRIMSRALNRTATEARTKTGRLLAQRSGLRVRDARARIYVQKASYYKWRAGVILRDRAIPLISLKARQTKKGVSYRDPAQRGRILLRHAFIAKMPSGHRGVFMRTGTKRLPIKEQFGPRLRDIFDQAPEEMMRIYRESQEKLQRNIHDQVQLILKRRAG